MGELSDRLRIGLQKPLGRVRALQLYPRRPAGTIGTISAFRNQTLLQAARNRSGPISPCLKEAMKMPRVRRTRSRAKIGLAHPERKMPHVLAGEHVEGVVLNILVMLSGIKRSKSDRPSTPRMTASHQ
jgi:hypothetical protein